MIWLTLLVPQSLVLLLLYRPKLCIYCDKTIADETKYHRHVENCRALAEKQQAEIEQKGYNNVFQHVEAVEEPEPRTTRARIRTPTRPSPAMSRRPLHESTMGDSPASTSRKEKLQAPQEGYKSGFWKSFNFLLNMYIKI